MIEWLIISRPIVHGMSRHLSSFRELSNDYRTSGTCRTMNRTNSDWLVSETASLIGYLITLTFHRTESFHRRHDSIGVTVLFFEPDGIQTNVTNTGAIWLSRSGHLRGVARWVRGWWRQSWLCHVVQSDKDVHCDCLQAVNRCARRPSTDSD